MNETKIEILNCLNDDEWWTTTEVAAECGLSLTNVSELLRRYRSQGLVYRKKRDDVPRGYWYMLTYVGFERLKYLCSSEVGTSSAIAELAGITGTNKRVLDRWIMNKLGG